jgi:hypothetical protein
MLMPATAPEESLVFVLTPPVGDAVFVGDADDPLEVGKVFGDGVAVPVITEVALPEIDEPAELMDDCVDVEAALSETNEAVELMVVWADVPI